MQGTEDRGPQVESTPWDEADNKAKSLIYLSLVAEVTNIIQQVFLHTDLQKFTTDALVELSTKNFVPTKNETFSYSAADKRKVNH